MLRFESLTRQEERKGDRNRRNSRKRKGRLAEYTELERVRDRKKDCLVLAIHGMELQDKLS